MLIPVVMCGGAGTRLWPVSRESFPKPLLRFSDGLSLFQKAFLRACRVPGTIDVLVVTNQEMYFLLQDEYLQLKTRFPEITQQAGFVLEPVGRNTAAAIASVTEVVRTKYGENTLILVLPADHLIGDEAALNHAISHAAVAAQQSCLVTFGIKPARAETGFGYIEFHPTPISNNASVHRVKRFIEKPHASLAQIFFDGGQHLWNAGMFCFTAKTLFTELGKHAPELADAAIAAVKSGQHGTLHSDAIIQLNRAAFEKIPSISIDHAVMEHSTQVAVVPCDPDWRDIGSWLSVSELSAPDARGNRVEGKALLYDADNCYIRADERLVGVVGVEHLIIVDTPDALLVVHRDRAQDVKHLVASLRQNGHLAHKLHRMVKRPWGTYTILEEGERFKIKRIVVKPGASLSLQMHRHRSEHWTVVQGCAEVLNSANGEKTFMLQPNESTYIPTGHKHRLANPGMVDLVLIEVQCGEYLGEDDIVRFDDRYGRP